MRKTRTAVIMTRFGTNCTISSEQIVIKTELKKEVSLKDFYLVHNNKGHLKGFQTNFKRIL